MNYVLLEQHATQTCSDRQTRQMCYNRALLVPVNDPYHFDFIVGICDLGLRNLFFYLWGALQQLAAPAVMWVTSVTGLRNSRASRWLKLLVF